MLCDHPAMPRRRSASAGPVLGSIALVVALLATGCGTSVPSTPVPSPTRSLEAPSAGPSATAEDPAAVYARIERQVEAIRGLPAKTTVDPVILDQAALDAALRMHFDKDNPATAIAAAERVDRALGLIPADASLKELQLELLSGQVIGFYDPDTKKMSVKSISGAIGVAEQITFAHEYDHALQDQQFDLSKLGIDARDQGDRSLARLALVEGDATLVMTQWAATALTPAQLLQYLAQSDITGQTAALAKLPAAMRAQLMFPYTTGLAFVQGLQMNGGWDGVNRAFASPPDSTEQVLHPEKYTAREAPVTVTVPADLATRLGAGWTVEFQDTFGEFGLRSWLQAVGGLDAAAASAAADGWGGDRVVLVANGATFALAIQTVWDTPADATAFAAAAGTTRARLSGSTALIDPGSTNRVTVFVASEMSSIERLAGALGLAG
jgi:hypothetical protein